jgi:Ca2+-binding EF-hand superfamily protein
MPTADEIIAECDKSGDGELSKKEVMGCIKKHAPSKEEGEEAADMVNKHWKDVAGKNGKVDKAELEQVMDEHKELAQAFVRDPSAAEVIAFCDGNGDGKLTKKEAIKCIDDHAPEADKAEAKEEINKHWKGAAGKDGKVDEAEMADAMKADMESLAQISKKKGKKGGKKEEDDKEETE